MAHLPAILHSNLPAGEKHWIQSLYENRGHHAARAKQHAIVGVHAIRSGAEGAVTGAGLAALDVYMKDGLDMPMGKATTLQNGQVKAAPVLPLDAAISIAAIVGGVALAHEGAQGPAVDLCNIGAAAGSVYAFRKTQSFLAQKSLKKGITPGFMLQDDYRKARGERPFTPQEREAFEKANKMVRDANKKADGPALAAHGDYDFAGETAGFGHEGAGYSDPIVALAQRVLK